MGIKAGQIVITSEQKPHAASATPQSGSTVRKNIAQDRPAPHPLAKIRTKRTINLEADGTVRKLPKGSPYLLDMLTTDE